MTKAQILEGAKNSAVGSFIEIFENLDAIQVGDFSYDIPVVVGEDIERFVNITFTAKDIITNDEGDKVEYDPQIVIDRWNFKKTDQAERKAERDRKHDETVKRAADRRAKAKAKADAKKPEDGKAE